MKKGLTKEEIREKVELLNTAGFKPIGYFIVAFRQRQRLRSKRPFFAMELKLYRAGFMPFHPLPGTRASDFWLDTGEISRFRLVEVSD